MKFQMFTEVVYLKAESLFLAVSIYFKQKSEFLWEKKTEFFRPAIVHSLFQMKKTLNDVTLRCQALCEHWKPLVRSWLSQDFTLCRGGTEEKQDMCKASNNNFWQAHKTYQSSNNVYMLNVWLPLVWNIFTHKGSWRGWLSDSYSWWWRLDGFPKFALLSYHKL